MNKKKKKHKERRKYKIKKEENTLKKEKKSMIALKRETIMKGGFLFGAKTVNLHGTPKEGLIACTCRQMQDNKRYEA